MQPRFSAPAVAVFYHEGAELSFHESRPSNLLPAPLVALWKQTGHARADGRLDEHRPPAPAREAQRALHDLREPRPLHGARELLERLRVVDLPPHARLGGPPLRVLPARRHHGRRRRPGVAYLLGENPGEVAGPATPATVVGE